MSSPEAFYTHGHHESVLRSHRWRTVDNSAAYVAAELTPGRTLLDVGCGPGTLTVDLARRLTPGLVTAIEPAEATLDLARAEAERQAITNVEFAVADVHALSFADGSFDIVHAHQVLQHLTDPVGALREMGRVCSPDGVVAVRDSDYAGFLWWPQIPELDEWLALYRTLARANGGEPDAGRRILSWARAAGFTDVTATSSTWCYASVDDRKWWGGLWADRLTQSAIARQAIESGAVDAAALARIADGWREWAAAEDGWMSVPHGEIVARPG